MRITLLEWVLATLAVFRLVWLVTEDEITKPLRKRIADRARDVDKGLAYLITCAWCCSVYIAAGVVVFALVVAEAWSTPLLGVAALSGITGFLASKVG